MKEGSWAGNPWSESKLFESEHFPSYFRPSVTVLPKTREIKATSGVCLGIIIDPGNASELHIEDCTNSNVVRCSKCSAYLSPWSTLSSRDSRWKCGICDYESFWISGGPPLSERYQFKYNAVDLKTKEEFLSLPNSGPCFAFAFDISSRAIDSGLLRYSTEYLCALIDQINDDSFILLITFDSCVTYYNLKNNRQTSIIELDSYELPPFELYKLREIKDTLKSVLRNLSALSRSSTQFNCYGSALKLAKELLNGYGGILLMFAYGYPSIGPSGIIPRGVEEKNSESQMLKIASGSSFYVKLYKQIANSGISLHLFSVGTECDLPTIGVICGLTGGRCFHYSHLSDPKSFYYDLSSSVMSEYFWDSSIRLRVSKGVFVSRTHANCSLSDNDLMIVPILRKGDSFAFELDINQYIPSSSVTFQLSLVWTNNARERMVRILTFSLPVSDNVSTVIHSIDFMSYITLVFKRALMSILSGGSSSGHSCLIKDLSVLKTNGTNQEIIGCFIRGMCKSSLFIHKGFSSIDDLFSAIIEARAMGIYDVCLFCIPRIVGVDGFLVPFEKTNTSFSFCLLHSHKYIVLWYESNGLLLNDFNTVVSDGDYIEISQVKNLEIISVIQTFWSFSRKYIPIKLSIGNCCINEIIMRFAQQNRSQDLTFVLPNNK